MPLTAEALGREARACLDAGAAMMHMHVRRPDGRHLLDAQAYRDALAAVRKAVGDELLVQVTSEAAGVYRAAEQMAMVRELAPEAVSVGLREIAVPEIPESELAAFLAWLAERRVLTQIILYDEADVRAGRRCATRTGAGRRLVGAVRSGPLQRGRPRPPTICCPSWPPATMRCPGPSALSDQRERLRHDRGGFRRPHARRLREQPEAARRRHRAGQRRWCGRRPKARAPGPSAGQRADARRIYGAIA